MAKGFSLWSARACSTRKGRAERAVWFRDLDGNVMGVGETVR